MIKPNLSWGRDGKPTGLDTRWLGCRRMMNSAGQPLKGVPAFLWRKTLDSKKYQKVPNTEAWSRLHRNGCLLGYIAAGMEVLNGKPRIWAQWGQQTLHVSPLRWCRAGFHPQNTVHGQCPWGKADGRNPLPQMWLSRPQERIPDRIQHPSSLLLIRIPEEGCHRHQPEVHQWTKKAGPKWPCLQYFTIALWLFGVLGDPKAIICLMSPLFDRFSVIYPPSH